MTIKQLVTDDSSGEELDIYDTYYELRINTFADARTGAIVGYTILHFQLLDTVVEWLKSNVMSINDRNVGATEITIKAQIPFGKYHS